MKLGRKGQGGLFVWVAIVMAIFCYSLMYVIFDYILENNIASIAVSLNATTAGTIMNDTIFPIWRLSPWGFAIAVILYGIFYSINYTPEGRY